MRSNMILVVMAAAACGGSTVSSRGDVAVPPSLFVRAVIAPPSSGSEGTCFYSPDPSQPTLSSGTLDVMFATKYAPAILVGNTADANGVGGARAAITGFDVTVTDALGATIGSFHADAAGFLDGASGGTPYYGEVSATLLDAATVAVARMRVADAGTTRVVAHIVLTGKSAVGNPVKSVPFDFPIDLCDGCLVTFPPDVGPTHSGCGMPARPSSAIAQSCVIGQDQPIDCRLCYATHPSCRL